MNYLTYTNNSVYLLTTSELAIIVSTLIVIICLLIALIIFQIIVYRNNRKDGKRNLTKNQYIIDDEFIASLELIKQLIDKANITDNLNKKDEYCKQVKEVMDYVLLSIQNIFDIDIINNDGLEIINRLFDVKIMMAKIKSIYSPIAKRKGFDFQIYVANLDNELFQGDEKRLMQILINIINNIVNSTTKGEKVSLVINQIKCANNDFIRFNISSTQTDIDKKQILVLNDNTTDYNDFLRQYGNDKNLVRYYLSKKVCLLLDGIITAEYDESNGISIAIQIPFETKSEENNTIVANELYKGLILSTDNHVFDVFDNYTIKRGGLITKAFNSKEVIELLNNPIENNFNYVVIDLDIEDDNPISLVKKISEEHKQHKIFIIKSNDNDTKIDVVKSNVLMLCEKPLYFSNIDSIYAYVESSVETIEKEVTEKHDYTNKRLLIVEDNIISMEVAVNIFKTVGFQIDVASNGKEACEKFENSDIFYYDAIIMDIIMPIMDGYTATKNIRLMKRKDAITIPIIAFSTKTSKEEILEAKNNGMNDYITKPADFNKSISIVNKWINRQF